MSLQLFFGTATIKIPTGIDVSICRSGFMTLSLALL
jgi:hypothetical protein